MKFTELIFFVLSTLALNETLAADFNIISYGACRNDTTKVSTDAINAAIDACFKNGGGRVVIPAGMYKTGTIVLKDNVGLHFESGAFLFASTNPKDFPRQAQPSYRSQKDPGGWYALIYAEGSTNISISGNGTIDGQGEMHFSRPEALGGDRDGRPRNILFISCKNIKVSDVNMRNSGIWNQHYLNCEDVVVNNINVYNHSNKNNDGIDIDGCRRFILTNSIIDSDDDGIVLKSTGEAPCEDIVISNCIVSSYTNAIKCGTESTGGFKNINISNCTVKPSISPKPSFFGLSRLGITAISLEIVDGGTMDGVHVDNIVIKGTHCPIYVRLGNRARKHTAEAPEPMPGKMRNIHLSNITAYDTGNYSSSITGVHAAHIENIVLSNIRLVNTGGLQPGAYIQHFGDVIEDEKGYPEPTVWKELPSYGFFIRHVKNIVLKNISLESAGPEDRFPLIGVNVDDIEIDGFRTGLDTEKNRFKFFNVRNHHIINSKPTIDGE